MYIQTQLCSLAIMAFLVFFFKRHKRVGLFSERVFWITLQVAIVSVSLDFLSLVVISKIGSIPQLLVDLVCKLYLCSLVWVGFSALCYAATDMFSMKDYLRYWRKLFLGLLLACAVILILPIEYHVEIGEVYTLGPAVLMTYVFALLFVVGTLVSVVAFGKRMNPARRKSVLTWMFLWIICALIQFFNNQLLLVGFGCGLGMLVLFCTLENPETNMDRKFGCYHMHVLMQYFKEKFEERQSLSVLYLSMISQQNDGNRKEIEDGIMDIIKFTKNHKDVKVFKNVGDELVLVFEDMNAMNNLFREIQDTFYADHFYKEKNGRSFSMPNTLFVLLPDTAVVNSADEVLRVFNYLKIENLNINSTQVSYVNQMILDNLRSDEKYRQMILDALEDDRVEVFFQPIYSNTHQRFVSAEALVRIRNKDGGIVPPGQFIPIAERSRLILPLGERVFEKTCEFIRDSKVLEYGLEYIEINLSVVQCEQWNLAAHYLKIMEKYGIDPWRINLEITETGSVESKNVLLDNMRQLIGKGVTFSLDDFGNGQSNLDYMIDMPVSVMKLDMNMTKAYFKDLKAQYVVQATIKLAHDLDLLVVAEGVETQEEFEEMRRLGVDDIQGYFFSKPLEAAAFITFLKDRQSVFVDK